MSQSATAPSRGSRTRGPTAGTSAGRTGSRDTSQPVHPDLTYANLAVRGLTAAEVRRTQLDRALAMRPDIVVVVAGVNDVLRPRFDRAALRDNLFAMHEALAASGARVAAFTMPDMSKVAPLAVVLRPRLEALNEIVRAAGERFGTAVADLAAEPLASDPALWHDDRLHANTEGHRRVALALAESLGVDAGDWRAPLPEVPEPSRAAVLAPRGRLGRHPPGSVALGPATGTPAGGPARLQASRAAARDSRGGPVTEDERAAYRWHDRRGAAAAGLLSLACLVSAISGFFDGGLGNSKVPQSVAPVQWLLVGATAVVGVLAAPVARRRWPGAESGDTPERGPTTLIRGPAST